MQYIQENKTLYGTFFKYRNLLTDICLMGLAVVLLAIFANIRIPLWPVPITMQTFGVFLIAFFFGSKRGFTTILLYILTGLVGFGVFAGYKSGIATTLGPTGGYIIGFLAMAYFVGLMIEKGYLTTLSEEQEESYFLSLVDQVDELLLRLEGNEPVSPGAVSHVRIAQRPQQLLL